MGTLHFLTPQIAEQATRPKAERPDDAVCATGWGLLDGDPHISRHLVKAGQALANRDLCGVSVYLMYAMQAASARYGYLNPVPEALREFREVVMAGLDACSHPGGFDAVVQASHRCTKAIRAADPFSAGPIGGGRIPAGASRVARPTLGLTAFI
jgi:hypothetical protein